MNGEKDIFTLKDLEAVLTEVLKLGVSDILFAPYQTPLINRGEIATKMTAPYLTQKQVYNLAKELLNDKVTNIDEIYSKQISYEIEGLARFRVTISLGRDGFHVMFRLIPLETRSFAELNLPSHLGEIAQAKSGLILVTGPTGQGKSTTLSAMIHHINVHISTNIITLEDPIEFVYNNYFSVILQREVGVHVPSFKTGLKDALRHKPRVIMVGEILDGEDFNLALQAAESGHLVLTTLHSYDVLTALDRILSFFPDREENTARARLARSLTAIISQRLLPTNRSTPRLVPAVEIYRKNPTGSEWLKSGEFHKLFELIKKEGETKGAHNSFGMQTFDQHIALLLENEWIDLETALTNATNAEELKRSEMLSGKWIKKKDSSNRAEFHIEDYQDKP